jgi:hypothetical protein
MDETKSNCFEWSAIHNFMPPGPAHLTVADKRPFPTPGFKLTLKKKVPQGIDPSILLLEITVVPRSTAAPEVITTISVTPYDEITEQRYKEVEVLPDLTKINVKEVY